MVNPKIRTCATNIVVFLNEEANLREAVSENFIKKSQITAAL